MSLNRPRPAAALIGAAAMSLGCAFAGSLAMPAVARAEAPGLPAGKDVLAGHVKAIGGEKAIKGRTSRVMKGAFTMPSMGMGGDMTISQAAPYFQLVSFNIPGMGEVRQGFDGETSWAMNPFMGAQIDTSATPEELRIRNEFNKDLSYATRYATIETVEKVEWRGGERFKVRLVDTTGKETFEYFDTTTGFRVGEEGTEKGPDGAESRTVGFFEDYKDFGGVMCATKLTFESDGQSQVMTVASVEWDTLDKSAFELPQEIKDLKGK